MSGQMNPYSALVDNLHAIPTKGLHCWCIQPCSFVSGCMRVVKYLELQGGALQYSLPDDPTSPPPVELGTPRDWGWRSAVLKERLLASTAAKVLG